MGSKAQRQNQHIKRLERKIRQFQSKVKAQKMEKNWDTLTVVRQSSKLVVMLIQE